MVCLSLDPKKSRISGGSKAAVENAAKKLFLVVNFEGMWLDWETNIVCGEAICISLLHIVHFIPWQPAFSPTKQKNTTLHKNSKLSY